MEQILFAEYKQKFNIESETVSGPINLKLGWIWEEWLRIYFSDINRDYSSVLGKTDLIYLAMCYCCCLFVAKKGNFIR